MKPELPCEPIDVVPILIESLLSLRRVRDLYQTELITADGRLSDKTRAVLLAALDDPRQLAEKAAHLWSLISYVDQTSEYEAQVLAELHTVAPQGDDLIT